MIFILLVQISALFFFNILHLIIMHEEFLSDILVLVKNITERCVVTINSDIINQGEIKAIKFKKINIYNPASIKTLFPEDNVTISETNNQIAWELFSYYGNIAFLIGNNQEQLDNLNNSNKMTVENYRMPYDHYTYASSKQINDYMNAFSTTKKSIENNSKHELKLEELNDKIENIQKKHDEEKKLIIEQAERERNELIKFHEKEMNDLKKMHENDMQIIFKKITKDINEMIMNNQKEKNELVISYEKRINDLEKKLSAKIEEIKTIVDSIRFT